MLVRDRAAPSIIAVPSLSNCSGEIIEKLFHRWRQQKPAVPPTCILEFLSRTWPRQSKSVAAALFGKELLNHEKVAEDPHPFAEAWQRSAKDSAVTQPRHLL